MKFTPVLICKLIILKCDNSVVEILFKNTEMSSTQKRIPEILDEEAIEEEEAFFFRKEKVLGLNLDKSLEISGLIMRK